MIATYCVICVLAYTLIAIWAILGKYSHIVKTNKGKMGLVILTAPLTLPITFTFLLITFIIVKIAKLVKSI